MLGKLGIIPGFSCTLACKHCITSSKPNHSVHLTNNEIEHLIEDIATNSSNITELIFSGGEPSLYIDSINKILSGIKSHIDGIKISMVTNGHFATDQNSCEFLLDLPKLDSLSMSYDEFHELGISFERVVELNKFCAKHDLHFEVNCVLGSPQAYKYEKLCHDHNIPFFLSTMAFLGRAQSLETTYPQRNKPIDIESTCAHLHGAVYLPGRGYSWCIKNLTWESKEFDNLIFSNTIKGLFTNNYYKHLHQTPFSQMLTHLGKSRSDYRTGCEICSEYTKCTKR